MSLWCYFTEHSVEITLAAMAWEIDNWGASRLAETSGCGN